jgi:hypothetical protein
MIKKIVAREWLYLLGFVVASLVVLPLPLMLILGPQKGTSGFYKALFEGVWIAWLIVITPYLIFQLVRSVLWALRALRE